MSTPTKTPDFSLLDKYLASLGHEVRGPLHIINMAVDFLMDSDGKLSNEDEKLALSQIHLANQQVATLTERIMDLSRMGQKQTQLLRSQFDALELLNTQIQIAQDQARSDGIALKLVEAPSEMTINADRGKMSQIFYSCIEVLVYLSDGGCIEVSAKDCSDGTALFSFKADEPGLIEEDDSLDGKILSLWLAEEFTKAHGGSWTVDGGSTISVHIPIEVV